jgi:hypothetical protein
MTRDELLALAARVEAATGADQILDAAVLLVVSPELASRPWEQVTYPDRKRAFFADRSDPDGSNVVSPPAFTSSLDAAASLVPDGWDGGVYWSRRSGSAAHLHLVADDRIAPPATSKGAATSALALTAAAIRAKAQEAGDE